jgi:hypothetical protein
MDDVLIATTLWLSKHRPSATPSTTFNLHDLPCGYQNTVHRPLPACRLKIELGVADDRCFDSHKVNHVG